MLTHAVCKVRENFLRVPMGQNRVIYTDLHDVVLLMGLDKANEDEYFIVTHEKLVTMFRLSIPFKDFLRNIIQKILFAKFLQSLSIKIQWTGCGFYTVSIIHQTKILIRILYNKRKTKNLKKKKIQLIIALTAMCKLTADYKKKKNK